MKTFFNLTESIKTELESNALINSVTYGDLYEVDLQKQNIFPLAHVNATTGSIGSATTSLNVSILFLDIVGESKEEQDAFYGDDNEHYVLNSMLAAATKTSQELLRGNLYADGYEVEDSVNVELFSERFEDKLAGVGLDFSVTIKNSVDLC